jgi:dihydroorotase/N-acyl-D-amino-acid deacylase
VIDVKGKVVSPGFIDIHTHAEDIESDPTAHNYIMQGVTTLVSGNCGSSKCPLKPFFKKLEEKGISINFASYIGMNTIRQKIMQSENRNPTLGEMSKMKKLVAEGMRDGAIGLSTGLKYNPASFAKTDEVIALAQVATEYGGIYASHIRSEGTEVIDALKEAIKIGEKAKIPVQISHYKILSVKKWGKSVITNQLIEDARNRGIDIQADQYPYLASSTGLSVLFPSWAFDGGDWKEKIKDSKVKQKLLQHITDIIENERAGSDLNRISISKCTPDTALEGKGLAEILLEQNKAPTVQNAAHLVIELLLKGNTSAIYHTMSESDVENIMKNPVVMIASDGSITKMNVGAVHPRSYGTFPRILSVYVREKRLLSLEKAIHKMTYMVASRLGLSDTGLISPGKRADLVVFDPKQIRDKATFKDPHQYPEGIDYVFVNGEIVMDNGKITDKRPGRVIYGPGKK